MVTELVVKASKHVFQEKGKNYDHKSVTHITGNVEGIFYLYPSALSFYYAKFFTKSSIYALLLLAFPSYPHHP